MVLDASALVSVILGEASSETVLARLGEARVVAVGAPALVEAAIVLSARLGRDARPMLNELLRELEAEVIPFSREHYEAAVDAFRRYGKGRRAAALNFGDCLAYAVASVAGLPLVFTGDDFAKTDAASWREE